MPASKLRYFLFSQYLADGIRMTLCIILPVWILSVFNHTGFGFTMATGALCVSITDIPGPIEHKKNGMLYSIGFGFIVTLLTGLLNQHVVTMTLLIAAACFFFSMFSVYGNRAALVGSAVLLAMILRIPLETNFPALLRDACLQMAGGFFYLLVALISFRLTPYRPAQRALGDCIHELSKYLRIKANLYDTGIDYTKSYRELMAQQIVIHEKQEALRELLFKDKTLMKEPTKTGKLLMVTFADSVDLYEQIMATWYDYDSLRDKYKSTGLLGEVSEIIIKTANELDRIGMAIQSNGTYKREYEMIPDLDKLKLKIDQLDQTFTSHFVLLKILVNLRNLDQYLIELGHYFSAHTSRKGKFVNISSYAGFVAHQEINPTIFRNNLSMHSSIFRHALRMTITCVIGYILTRFMAYDQHSNWVLLTTLVILKPAYSLTKQRNTERLVGTVVGAIIGVLAIVWVKDQQFLFAILLFFMIGTYTFQRLNYIVMVIFITPYILIVFNLMGYGLLEVARARIFDTAIAAALAFAANHLLFPSWESSKFTNLMAEVLKANIQYLNAMRQFFSGKEIPALEYKLLRKQIYVSSTNLSAAFQRMLAEPKSKQKDNSLIYEFIVLNDILSANAAGIGTDILKNKPVYDKEVIVPLNRCITLLEESSQHLGEKHTSPVEVRNVTYQHRKASDKSLQNQLQFIQKISADIEKVSKEIVVN